MNPAERYVFDSFALLAYFENEAGANSVETLLATCATGAAEGWMSIINVGEVLYITEREQGLRPAQKAVALLDQLPLRIANADRTLTFAAAHIKAHYPLSYADAFAVALAQQKDAVVVTGDPAFRQVEAVVEVRWLEQG